MLPLPLLRAAYRRVRGEGRPVVFYIHPWELDEWVPVVDAPRLQMIRTFFGRRRTWTRMDVMLRRFSFGPIRGRFEKMQLEG